MRILTIEDDQVLAGMVAKVLRKQHYAVDVVMDGQAGWDYATSTDYDLILLDIMLPKLDGISLCRQLRQSGCQTSILLLTGKDSGQDKAIGLDAGADDYVVKPVNFEELMARIRALLRRSSSASTTAGSVILEWESLRLDPSACAVTYNHHPLSLTPTEYSLLELFLRNGQRILSRSAIVDHLWAFDDSPQEATIKSYIKSLRKKLKAVDAPADLIETVHGLGYRLKFLSTEQTVNPQIGEQIDPQIGEAIHEQQPPASLVLGSRDAATVNGINSRTIDSGTIDSGTIEQQVLAAVIEARASFCRSLPDRLTLLKQAAQGYAQGKLSHALWQQATQEAHQLSGTLGTIGFDRAAQIVESIEGFLQDKGRVCSQEIEPKQRFCQLVSQLCQALEQTLSALTACQSQGSPPAQVVIASQDEQLVQPFIKLAANQGRSIKIAGADTTERSMTVHPVEPHSEDSTAAIAKQVFDLMNTQSPDVILLDRTILLALLNLANVGEYE